MISLLKIIQTLVICIALIGCSSRKPFWSYVVEGKVEKPLEREQGEKIMPRALSPHNVKVAFNDGATRTEVLIPVLVSGQQIIIDHRKTNSPTALSAVPEPPTEADKTIEDSYVKSGGAIKKQAVPISISKTLQKVRNLFAEGQYSLALESSQQILDRYPNHVQTLRAKGSILLKMGEKEAAYDTYTKAQELEFDPRVETILKNLDKDK